VQEVADRLVLDPAALAVAEDEICLHVFEAPSAAVAGEASRRAAIAYNRIVEAIE